jgi:hypothetical protein
VPPSPGNGSSISDRARTTASADDQMEIGEKQIDNADLATLLDERGRLNDERLAAIRAFDEKDRQAKARLSEYELAVGEVARVGRWKVKKQRRAGGDREFTVAPSEPLRIDLAD